MPLAHDDTDTALAAVIAGLLLVLRLQCWPNIKLTLTTHENSFFLNIFSPIEYTINVYMIVLIKKIIDWNRFANQLIDTSKNLQCITHHLDISDQVMCLYI